jgi:hypothetical protein
MRMPKGRFSAEPGPRSAAGEECRAHGVNPEFYDPEGQTFGIPTYPFHLAPEGYATRRQLRLRNLCPGGKPIQAQIIWKHKGIGRNGRGSTTRRVAYLYALKEAKPKRVPTSRQLEAVNKALAARRTCRECGVEQDYYIPRSRGECNRCAEPELYAGPAPESSANCGWDNEWDCQPADNDWDSDALAAEAQMSQLAAGVDMEAS